MGIKDLVNYDQYRLEGEAYATAHGYAIDTPEQNAFAHAYQSAKMAQDF